MTPGNPPRSGLWLAAFFMLLIGSVISGAIYYFHEVLDNPLQWQSHFWLSIFITSLAVGITGICASAHWWMHR